MERDAIDMQVLHEDRRSVAGATFTGPSFPAGSESWLNLLERYGR